MTQYYRTTTNSVSHIDYMSLLYILNFFFSLANKAKSNSKISEEIQKETQMVKMKGLAKKSQANVTIKEK